MPMRKKFTAGHQTVVSRVCVDLTINMTIDGYTSNTVIISIDVWTHAGCLIMTRYKFSIFKIDNIQNYFCKFSLKHIGDY